MNKTELLEHIARIDKILKLAVNLYASAPVKSEAEQYASMNLYNADTQLRIARRRYQRMLASAK